MAMQVMVVGIMVEDQEGRFRFMLPVPGTITVTIYTMGLRVAP
ncbi:hypothetical protein Gogos_020751 [Gossypium gossypioides]|uniref:Uncharacterized protein n=1 Tax=Gossypium gossypioides TaxID=34282 RepID=A0A7J9CXC7_GOSGO|nr:hypothetical protein [Gossypium gossypioides]